MTRPVGLSIFDLNGAAHECVAEAFDGSWNVLYPIRARPQPRGRGANLAGGLRDDPSLGRLGLTGGVSGLLLGGPEPAKHLHGAAQFIH